MTRNNDSHNRPACVIDRQKPLIVISCAVVLLVFVAVVVLLMVL